MIDNLSIVRRFCGSFCLIRTHSFGFLMLECMVAILLLTLSAVTVAWYQWNMTSWHMQAQKQVQALQAARMLLETISVRGCLPVPQRYTHDGITLSCSQTPHVVGASSVQLLGGDVTDVRVTAQWHAPSGTLHTITLCTCVLVCKGGVV